MNRLYLMALFSGGASAAIFLAILLSLAPHTKAVIPPSNTSNNTGTQPRNITSTTGQNNSQNKPVSTGAPGPTFFYAFHANVSKTEPPPPKLPPAPVNQTPPATQGGQSPGGNVIFNGGGGGGGGGGSGSPGGAANSPPVAKDQTVSTTENTSVAITLAASDPDGDFITYAVLSNPLHGSITGTAPHLVYSPQTGFSGQDNFRFIASDGISTDAATVSIIVKKVLIYNLQFYAGNESITGRASVGELVTAVATTNDRTVKNVTLTWSLPSGQAARKIDSNISNGQASDTFNVTTPGSWTVKADFGNGNVVSKSLVVTMFVVPESPGGSALLVGASLGALGLFVLLKKRPRSRLS